MKQTPPEPTTNLDATYDSVVTTPRLFSTLATTRRFSVDLFLWVLIDKTLKNEQLTWPRVPSPTRFASSPCASCKPYLPWILLALFAVLCNSPYLTLATHSHTASSQHIPRTPPLLLHTRLFIINNIVFLGGRQRYVTVRALSRSLLLGNSMIAFQER